MVVDCPFAISPQGCSQWQSQTAARREGKCRAPVNNQYYIHDTRTEIGFTDRLQDIRNPSYIIFPITKYPVLDLVLHYYLKYYGANKSVESNHYNIN